MPTFTPTWLDPADVRDWLRDTGQPPASADAEVDRACRHAEEFAEQARPEWWVGEPLEYVPNAETYDGAMMLAAKLLRRRNSPAGVETFGDVGIAYVAKYDPEIARALRVEFYQRPGVG